MIKQMALYSIPRQMDGDVFWRYHTHEHAPAVLRVCGDALAKVAINRVVDITKGNRHYFGVVETWWRDRAAMKAGLQALGSKLLPNGKSIAQDYLDRLAHGEVAFEVDEFVAKKSSRELPSPPAKYRGFYSLPHGTDPDEFWKYHTCEHAVHSVDSFDDYLEYYVINRVSRVIKGQPVCFGVVELWFADRESLTKGFDAHKQVILPSGRNVSEDFNLRVVDAFGYVVEEFTAKA